MIRDIVLEARAEAGRLHSRLGAQATSELLGGGIDVFGAINDASIPLLFRPLDRLLGAYLPPPEVGIIVTSERPLAIQRFTGAHELGHHMLGHRVSLDTFEILDRDPKHRKYDPNEMAADAFASEFLLPDWIFESHAERQGWDSDSLMNPVTVYQLSLRVGASFEATLRQLLTHQFIDLSTFRKFRLIQPKTLKQELLRGLAFDKWARDVWLLTERDQGTLIQGGPEDVFLFKLRQHSGAGYLWRFDELENLGFSVIADEIVVSTPDIEVGGPVQRCATAVSTRPACVDLHLHESRPWDPESIAGELLLKLDLFKESGESQIERRAATAA